MPKQTTAIYIHLGNICDGVVLPSWVIRKGFLGKGVLGTAVSYQHGMQGNLSYSLEFLHGYLEGVRLSLQFHHHWSTHAAGNKEKMMTSFTFWEAEHKGRKEYKGLTYHVP